MGSTDLMDAIVIVKENERSASLSYAQAATHYAPTCALFEQLSEFENYHYERLCELEGSLQKSGEFIDYQGRELILPPILDVKFTQQPGQKSLMTVIDEAIKLEIQAEGAYASLAAKLDKGSAGEKMFSRLSAEEHAHYNILTKAYWSLNQTGKWTLLRP